MFGYIMINPEQLTKEDKDRYQALYCGLCRRLGVLHGMNGRMTLTYDMTFLAMLLSSLYCEEESTGTQRCVMHPLHNHEYVYSSAMDYAADLSIILAYYKCLDDWNDDHNVIALGSSKALQSKMEQAAARCPRQYEVIKNGLEELSKMERNNELNPDLPTNCFGVIMGELFVWKEDEYADTLRRMGAALGRFIYILDAVNDRKEDIKKQRYNPLISLMDIDFTSMLTMLIGECTREFDKLPLNRNTSIMKNILYSGVWMKYKLKERDEKHD